MQIKQGFVLLLVGITMFILSSCQPKEKPFASNIAGNFKIYFIKAGKADAIILSTTNHNVIIDCGEKDDGNKITEYLNKNNIEHIDYIFITHFDKDHIGGFPEVIQNISVGNIITPNYKSGKKEYENYVKAVNEKNLPITVLKNNMSFTLDDCLFEINPPQKSNYNSDNNFSLAISITHDKNKFLFTGDAEAIRIEEILKVFKGEYNFLKIPHHGRYNLMTQTLLTSVKPQYAVITDSGKNPAEDSTLNVLDEIGCSVYQTKDGGINILSNGTNIIVTQ